jgi:quercetin dioxygenase-like cupin family protein
MDFTTVNPDELDWITRPHEPDEPARHVCELSEAAGLAELRMNVWRYEPGARGKRHRHRTQEETFLVLRGTLSMYTGEPPQRVDVPAGSLIRIAAQTPLQSVNHGDDDLVVHVTGYPPEDVNADILTSAV